MSHNLSNPPAGQLARSVAPARYVTVRLYSQISGKTEGAIRKKIERGIWLEGQHYRRDPEGCIWINREGVEQWVEGMG
jgi:hypothetical protein